MSYNLQYHEYTDKSQKSNREFKHNLFSCKMQYEYDLMTCGEITTLLGP